MSEFMDAALEYAARGWRVFPLIPGMKEPATDNGFKDATSDVGQIESWWKLNPRYNIGIATGSGLCVIDVDDKPEKHGGLLGSDFLRDWEIEHGDISETCCVKTPTGGMHYYFDVGDTEIDSCQSDTIFIDIRCDKGYIVAPPSIHPDTGTAYEWDISPEEMMPASVTQIDRDCIDWIYANRKGADKDGNTDTSLPDEPIHEGNGRNNFLFSQGRSQRAKGASDELVADWLTILNKKYCLPPLPDSELWKTIGSVCSVAPGLSDEAKAAQKKSSNAFKHNIVARKLINEQGACLIDGVTPAIRVDGKQYALGWDAIERETIKMHDDCKMGNRREVQAYIKATAPRKKQSPWNLIAFENGVLDILTMEFRAWADDDVICNVIPHRWNPEAKSELLYSTLTKMANGDTATLMNLQEFIGICMIRSNTRLPFYPVLIGEGSNGKSTYIKLLKAILGIDNISALQPKEISAHFMGEHIVGKLANLGDDIADGYLDGEDCGAIKRISTGENIFTDVKGTKGFYFEPYCTMVFSCNTFPRCKDTTDGFMRRLFPIEFNATFTPDDDDYDPLITEKLMSEEVLEYACKIGIEGLRRAVNANQPTPNRFSAEVKKSIAAESNTALQWITDEGITPDDVIGHTKDEVYMQYVDWCARNGYSKTAIASGTLIKFFGTLWHLTLTRIEHRTYTNGRKTVKTFEKKADSVPVGATEKEQVNNEK